VDGEQDRAELPMAESQLVGLQNMRVLLEETRLLAYNLAYHRRAKASIRDRKRLGFYGIPARSVLSTRRRLVALPPSAAAPWL
jgi:hypothetical protein